jgi:hypothetical protein
MGRRSGWENAYLDYENLKLLLSQAASVYEQHGAERSSSYHEYGQHGHGELMDAIVGGPSDLQYAGNSAGENTGVRRDFRDELFLESDSDKAFASSINIEDESDDEDSYFESGKESERKELMDPFPTSDYQHTNIAHRQQPLQFPFSYSAQGGLFSSSSGGDSDESNADHDDTCGSVVYNPFRSGAAASTTTTENIKKAASKGNKSQNANKDKKKFRDRDRKRQRQQKKQLQHQQQLLYEDNYYPSSKSAALFKRAYNDVPDTFIVEDLERGEDDQEDGVEGDGGRGNGGLDSPCYTCLYTSMAKSSHKSLLPPSTVKRPASHFTMDTRMGSPTSERSARKHHVGLGNETTIETNPQSQLMTYGSIWNEGSPSLANDSLRRNAAASQLHRNRDEEKLKKSSKRKEAWKKRQKRRLARIKREQEKRLPAHIRVAHAKARSITERFLGLLRAEVEKVTLFAHARLGELAETTGSLRFLSSEELTNFARDKSSVFDYSFSDGGIHPSASSSSDEGAGREFSWSDSSSEDEVGSEDHDGGRFDFAGNPFSSSTELPKTDATLKLASGRRKGKSFSATQERFEASKRKIAHYQDARRGRPIFQRNDHIVGDDLLLVSAVDEADAFTSVAVEVSVARTRKMRW